MRVGVLGCGVIAQRVHLPLLSRQHGVTVAAVSDPLPEQLTAARSIAPSAKPVASANELIDPARIDAVLICSPTTHHAAQAQLAVERGVHVYLEKPIATSLADAIALRDAWRRSSVVGMIGFNYRFNPLFMRLRSRLNAGAIGQLVAIRTTFRANSAWLLPWKRQRATGGGALLELGSHHIDLVRWLAWREIASVSAVVESHESEDDWAAVHMRLEGDGEVDVQSLVSFGAAPADRVELVGERGRLVVERSTSWDVRFESAASGAGLMRDLTMAASNVGRLPFVLDKLRSPLNEPSYRRALEHFIAAVRSDRRASTLRPDFQDGVACLTVIDAAERSARDGRTHAVGRHSQMSLMTTGGAQ